MKIAILVAPGAAIMDLAPAHGMFSMIPGAEVHTVWKSKETIIAGPGVFPILPTTTFKDCPRDLDVLFAPAVGPEVHEDKETLRFLSEHGMSAKWITSVCGGALILGVAGLLKGYQTATHWAYDDLLIRCGATISTKRVVVDRNRITSDGGSAAIEHTLVMARLLVGEEFAQEVELMMEWDPQPEFAFGVGSPEKAGKELTSRVLRKLDGFLSPLRQAIETEIASNRLEFQTA